MSQIVNNTENLYSILCRGDRSIDRAHQKAIILVGLTRVGKSTVYNWILKKQMIGTGDQIIPYYTNVIGLDSDTAEIKESIVSVTLAPNIHEYSKEEKISLIDMAGYQDKRNYVGVYGVSYFLKSVFEKVKHVKFVIVIDEENLALSSGEGIMKTFSGFLNMFDLTQIRKSQQALNNFYSSISLCVTKSQRPRLHNSFLQRICNQMRNNTLVAQNKDQIIGLIQNIINTSNRIQQFKKARFNQYAETTTMIERFDRLNWQYFNIQKKFIKLPFQKEFDNLPGSQQKQFEENIKNRIKYFLEFSKILKQLIKSIHSKWASAIYDWNYNKVLDLKFTYQETFNQIQQYLRNNDFYNSQDLVKQQFRIDYNELNLVKIINTIIDLYSIIGKVSNVDKSFQQNMVSYSQLYKQACQKIRLFCLNKEQQNLIQRLKFVIDRGFKEFSKLYQIQQGLVVEVNQEMKDKCNQVFEQKETQFYQRFIKEIDYKILSKMFDKIDGLNQYDTFFKKFQQQYKGHVDSQFNDFKNHQKNIDLYKANLYEKNQKQKLALKCYLKVLKCLNQIKNEILQSNDKTPEQKTNQLQKLFMDKRTTLGFVTNILKKLPVVDNSKNYALQICINANFINEACQIYEMIINQADNNAKKLQHYNDYIEYCLKWGRPHFAITLLQKKLDLEREDIVTYKQNIEKITEVARNIKKNSIYFDDFITNSQGLFTKIEQNDQSLDLYDQIDKLIIQQ